MPDPVATEGQPSMDFPFAEVHDCKIHPGFGIARVGNSPAEYFIGPEAPRDPCKITAPEGSFKDGEGRIKRQAARFRIYAYDKNGKNLGELPLQSADSRRDGIAAAEVKWTVHLANKKGAWYKVYTCFDQPGGIRNADIPVAPGQLPDSRLQLVIDPETRSIDGEGNPVGPKGSSVCFDTGRFRQMKVPLGELRVDDEGRLIVFGGFGHSGSTKPGNPIGSDPAKDDYWANNDYWYDDISDGPVTAVVTLPNGKKVTIDRPQDAAWVVVAPPKYAPAIYPIVTLYDVMREVALDQKWIPDEPVTYFGDIDPILRRAVATAWVNEEAKRGHGFDKRGDFSTTTNGMPPPSDKKRKGEPRTRVTAALLASQTLAAPDDSKEDRKRIFQRIRNPDLDGPDAVKQANYGFMPPLSGDGEDRTPGEPKTWLSILPSQYRKFEQWKDGNFDRGDEPVYPELENMSPNEQTEALQRAALEPCIGGAFYPGIEVPWTVRDAKLYAAAFRIDSGSVRPGDITKYMCVPWQADFYECRDSWWPAARPDDVIPEDVFVEADKAWIAGQPQLSEALEGRVKWDRGLGVTTLFRRPWHNPAEAFDDPRDKARRGCDDMVRYWHELGFVVPRKTPWWETTSADSEYVHVEMERRPHAGMDVRELFHCLLNLDENRTCLPKVEEFVCDVLRAARELQQTAGAFAWMDNIRPFAYDESVFDARMQDIYDDCADFAFTEKIGDVRVRYDPANPEHNPYFRTRDNVTERIRQLAPFNFLDGSWLRNIHRVGPVDEVNAILFTILKEELGDGVVSQNHANIYRDLCHSFGFYPPPMQSTAFAYDQLFLDCAFDSPAFQLGISEFSRRFYPEIIGMSLWLEWSVMELHRIASIAENVNLSSHFYRMHIAIDNAAAGHGAGIIRAVKLYLRQVRNEGGETAVQQHWQRIWDGYVAFAYTFVIVIRQVIRIIQEPSTLEDRLKRMIREKAPFGQYNHGRRKLGESSINALFSNPDELLKALRAHGYIIPGKPSESPFFKLLEFRGGRMYHVFTEDEIKLWRDWTWELGEEGKNRRGHNVRALRERLASIDAKVVEDISDAQLSAWQLGAAHHRIALWLDIAIAAKKDKAQQHGGKREHEEIIRSMTERFRTWLGWGMIRAVTYIAAQHRQSVERMTLVLPVPDTNLELTIPEWFDRITDAPNSAAPARDLLQSLGEALRTRKEFLEPYMADGSSLFYTFDNGIPGNDGRLARDTMKAWLEAGCPLPEVPKGRVKPLRLDASLNEEERHPTGVVMGFGTVH